MYEEDCLKTKADPEKLSERLFRWELDSEWEIFRGAVKIYADVLGEKGLEKYRIMAEKEWEKVPQRFNLTGIMVDLAELSGDTEALVAVKKKDLGCAYHYLEIAEIYRKARRPDKALEWAEAGVKAFPEGTDSRLREFLAREYHGLRRHSEAVGIIWKQFRETPTLDSYKLLKEHSDVEIFLWEKKYTEAWAEAEQGGCSNDLWLKLASIREKDNPQDALLIYRRQIEPLINQGDYEKAVKFIKIARQLSGSLKRGAEFNDYLEQLKKNYRRKRNFMVLMAKLSAAAG